MSIHDDLLVLQQADRQAYFTEWREAAEAYRKALVNYEESFLFYRQTSKTDRHAEAMAMSATHGEHIVAEARLKAALTRLG